MRTAAARPSTLQTQIITAITAMNAAVKIIAACQSVIARFLPPDGIREDFALQELVKILDGPEAVALTMQPASTVTQLQEAQAAMAARRKVVRSFTSGQGAVAQAPHEPSEVTIVRLREELARVSDELERKRKAENDLINLKSMTFFTLNSSTTCIPVVSNNIKLFNCCSSS